MILEVKYEYPQTEKNKTQNKWGFLFKSSFSTMLPWQLSFGSLERGFSV